MLIQNGHVTSPFQQFYYAFQLHTLIVYEFSGIEKGMDRWKGLLKVQYF